VATGRLFPGLGRVKLYFAFHASVFVYRNSFVEVFLQKVCEKLDQETKLNSSSERIRTWEPAGGKGVSEAGTTPLDFYKISKLRKNMNEICEP
jgi:hypothetical protein